MSAVGVNIDQFDVPVCNTFQARIVNDQPCYEVDLNRVSNKSNISDKEDIGNGMAANLLESDKNQHAFIYLETIGKELRHKPTKNQHHFFLYLYRAS